MKKSFFCFIFAVFSVFAFSYEKDVQKFELKNGIPLYLKSMPDNRINVLYIVVKGGTNYLSCENSGLEEAVFSLLSQGSKNYSYEELQSFSYDTLTSFFSSAGQEGSVFGLTCIDKYFDESFKRFADGFLNPLFEEKQYNLLITEYNQSIQETLNNPQLMLFYYAEQLIYQNHPYAVSPSVTPESLTSITIQNIKNHHKTLLDSRRIYFVACGNFNSEELLFKLNDSFSGISPLKSPLKQDFIEPIKVKGQNAVFVHESSSGTAYVMRVFSIPSVLDKDYPATRLISDIYSDILYNVVRENYGICYTPQSFVTSSKAPYGCEFLYRVSNLQDFSKRISEARTIMLNGKIISGRNKDGSYIFEDLNDHLEDYKNSYINKKFASAQTTQGLASRICAGLLQANDIYFSDELTQKVKSLTVQDILRVFEKYWISESSRWFAVTSPEQEESVCFE